LLISIAVILDIALNFKAYHSWKFSSVLRLLLKLLVAVAWVVVLPVCYLHSWENPTGILKLIKDWVRERDKIPSLYISAVIIYLLPNILGAVLFLLPSLRTLVEKSNWKIFQFLLWWSQVR
jgi:callose synthase